MSQPALILRYLDRKEKKLVSRGKVRVYSVLAKDLVYIVEDS